MNITYSNNYQIVSANNNFSLLQMWHQHMNIQPMDCIIEPSENLGGIWQGNMQSATNLQLLQKYNIGAVLTVAGNTNISYKEKDNIIHKVINARDTPQFNLSNHFVEISDFIQDVRETGINILVHCYAGISRSSTSIISYLMIKEGWNLQKALELCKQKRQITRPNPGFMRQLMNLESFLIKERQRLLQEEKQLKRKNRQNNKNNKISQIQQDDNISDTNSQNGIRRLQKQYSIASTVNNQESTIQAYQKESYIQNQRFAHSNTSKFRSSVTTFNKQQTKSIGARASILPYKDRIVPQNINYYTSHENVVTNPMYNDNKILQSSNKNKQKLPTLQNQLSSNFNTQQSFYPQSSSTQTQRNSLKSQQLQKDDKYQDLKVSQQTLQQYKQDQKFVTQIKSSYYSKDLDKYENSPLIKQKRQKYLQSKSQEYSDYIDDFQTEQQQEQQYDEIEETQQKQEKQHEELLDIQQENQDAVKQQDNSQSNNNNINKNNNRSQNELSNRLQESNTVTLKSELQKLQEEKEKQEKIEQQRDIQKKLLNQKIRENRIKKEQAMQEDYDKKQRQKIQFQKNFYSIGRYPDMVNPKMQSGIDYGYKNYSPTRLQNKQQQKKQQIYQSQQFNPNLSQYSTNGFRNSTDVISYLRQGNHSTQNSFYPASNQSPRNLLNSLYSHIYDKDHPLFNNHHQESKIKIGTSNKKLQNNQSQFNQNVKNLTDLQEKQNLSHKISSNTFFNQSLQRADSQYKQTAVI